MSRTIPQIEGAKFFLLIHRRAGFADSFVSCETAAQFRERVQKAKEDLCMEAYNGFYGFSLYHDDIFPGEAT